MLLYSDDNMRDFTAIGISKHEQLVYITLLNEGVESVRGLSQVLGMKRTTLYLYLEQLKEKGLIFEITDQNKKYFQAVSPKGLQKVIADKIAELKSLEKDLPELIDTYKSVKRKKKYTSSKLYKGVISLPELVEQVANSHTDIHFLGSIKGLQHYLGFDLLEQIYTRQRRKNLKITDYLISDWAASTIRRYYEEKGMFSKIRFLPPDLEPKGCFVGFDNKLIVGQFFPKPNALVIEDPTMVSMFKMAFLSLWNNLENKHIPPYQKEI